MKQLLLTIINLLLIGSIHGNPSIETHSSNAGKKLAGILTNDATVKWCGEYNRLLDFLNLLINIS